MSIVLFCVEFIVLAFHVIVHWGVGCTGDKSIVNFWRTFYHGWYQATFLVILAFALPVFFLTLKVWNMKEDIYIFDDQLDQFGGCSDALFNRAIKNWIDEDYDIPAY